jgi:hypothetical protein
MICSRVCSALTATMVVALPGLALAQFPPPPGTAPQGTVQNRWPEPPHSPPQAEPAPAPQAAPKRQPTQAKTAPDTAEPLQAAKPKPAPHVAAYAVACSGVFAKDTTHLKLAIKYDSRNVTFGQVDGPDGSKIPASILFPNDPKRRLEVLWNNDAARTDPSVIAINGKSQWTAPKGLRLGLPLATLEKLNGKPFKLSGFGADGIASVAGWEGGALSSLPGGCKVGIRLAADAKAPQDERTAVTGEKELLSSDARVRAVKPAVMEILIGY